MSCSKLVYVKFHHAKGWASEAALIMYGAFAEVLVRRPSTCDRFLTASWIAIPPQ